MLWTKFSNRQVECNDDGLTTEGDMRQATHNLHSTWSGFGLVSSENLFSVCDQPHPIIIQIILEACQKRDKDTAMEKILDLWDQGIVHDVVVTICRVAKVSDKMPEYTKAELLQVLPQRPRF